MPGFEKATQFWGLERDGSGRFSGFVLRGAVFGAGEKRTQEPQMNASEREYGKTKPELVAGDRYGRNLEFL